MFLQPIVNFCANKTDQGVEDKQPRPLRGRVHLKFKSKSFDEINQQDSATVSACGTSGEWLFAQGELKGEQAPPQRQEQTRYTQPLPPEVSTYAD